MVPSSLDVSEKSSLVELRKIAVKTLAQVFHSHQSLDQSLAEELARSPSNVYSDFDRSWIYEICSGVLRFRGRLDWMIDTYATKKKPTGALRRYLQTGVYQILESNVAPALAVSETVDAIRQAESEAQGKFANAILRKVAEEKTNWQNWLVTPESPFEEQLAWCSLPEWMFKKLRKERGSDWVFAFSKAILERPVIWYRELGKKNPIQLEGGYQGNEPKGYVQDISNQKLVQRVVDMIHSRFSNQAPRILDLCAAPGGKSLGLAEAGFQVTATDSDPERLKKVEENRVRLGFEDRITIANYKEIWNQFSSQQDDRNAWDVIWIDAPCTSTGIMRRHPEIKWNRTVEDLENLIQTQQQLLAWGMAHLAKKGIVIYSTCSLLRAENDGFDERAMGGPYRTLIRESWNPIVAPHGDGLEASVFTRA